MLDILILAIVAFLIYKKLFKVLGNTQYDREPSPEEKTKFEQFRKSMAEATEDSENSDKQIEIASGLEATLSESDRHTFDILRQNDPTLTAEKFIKGSQTAFEMILKALAEGNRNVLKQLLDPEVYNNFEQDINHRENSQIISEMTVVAFKACNIQSAVLTKKSATIIISFVTEQIKVTKDKISGNVISGSPSRIIEVNDTWSFSKNINDSSKVWKLVKVHGSEN